MMAVDSRSTTAPGRATDDGAHPPTPERKNYCPCGRYLGGSTATNGHMMVKCERCGVWRRVEFAPSVPDVRPQQHM